MSYFAAALARTDDGWVGRELDLTDVEDLDTVVDLVREVAGDTATGPALLFVEEDDEWFGVVRVDGDGDPRVFLSDSRTVETSQLASILYEEAAVEAGADPEPDEEGEEESIRPAAEPTGDLDLLADLGTPGDALLALCAEEGNLPSDIIAAVCEKGGCLEALEALREG